MDSTRFFLTKGRAVVVAIVAVAGIAWLWFGLNQGKDNQAATVAGNSPAATVNTSTGSAFVDANSKLEELVKRQQMLGQQAGGIAAGQTTTGVPAPGVAGANAVPGKETAAEAQRKQMDALMEARDTAVREIMNAGPGETKKIISAMEKLDAQMRAAGMPSVIDMTKFRQMIIGADHMQDISRRLAAENQKGRQADPAKIQSLLNELGAAQAAMPKTPYDTAVLEKAMKSGR